MDELNSQVPEGGVPLAPPGTQPGPVPGTPTPQPTMGGETGVASPEQMQELRQLLEAVRGKLGELNSAKLASGNVVETSRRDALRELFGILEEAGVDLTDPMSVNHFIMTLRERSPELAQQFEEAVAYLLGDDNPPTGEIPQEPISNPMMPQEPTPNPMINEAVPEDIRGPLPEGPPGGQLG